MLEARGQIDVKLAKLNGNSAAFRLSENSAFIEAMNQAMAETVIYGDTDVNPERFLGLTPRFSDIGAGAPANVDNIIDFGGEGSDNTSIHLVTWGEDSVHGIFPKGSQAGLVHQDLGEGDAFDVNGNRFRALMDLWQWDCGLVVKDWRYVVRGCNIDVPLIRSDATQMKALVTLLIDMEERSKSVKGKAAFYVNRTVRAAIRKGILEKISNNLTEESVGGKRVTMFNGIPIRVVDKILITEARVV
jgi:hypothetical protein